VGIQGVVENRAAGVVLGHEVVVTSFTTKSNDSSTSDSSDHSSCDGTCCDSSLLRLIIIQQSTKDSTLACSFAKVGLLGLIARLCHVVASHIEAANISVGANPLINDAPGNGVTLLNAAVVGGISSKVLGTRKKGLHASLARNASVVCSASVSRGTNSRRVLAWVLASRDRGITIVSGTVVSIIAHGLVGDEDTLRAVGGGIANQNVGGTWVEVIAHHRGGIASTSGCVAHSGVAWISVALVEQE